MNTRLFDDEQSATERITLDLCMFCNFDFGSFGIDGSFLEKKSGKCFRGNFLCNIRKNFDY